MERSVKRGEEEGSVAIALNVLVFFLLRSFTGLVPHVREQTIFQLYRRAASKYFFQTYTQPCHINISVERARFTSLLLRCRNGQSSNSLQNSLLPRPVPLGLSDQGLDGPVDHFRQAEDREAAEEAQSAASVGHQVNQGHGGGAENAVASLGRQDHPQYDQAVRVERPGTGEKTMASFL